MVRSISFEEGKYYQFENELFTNPPTRNYVGFLVKIDVDNWWNGDLVSDNKLTFDPLYERKLPKNEFALLRRCIVPEKDIIFAEEMTKEEFMVEML